MRSETLGPRVRLWTTLRSAHLERAHELRPATVLYRTRRYDFDEDLARGLHLVRAHSARAAWLLLTSDVRELEVNEPLMRSAVRRTALGVAAVRLGGLLRRRRTLVATYAIENDDRVVPGHGSSPGARLDDLLCRLVARQLDRVVYGTPAAARLYEEALPATARRGTSTTVPALPAPCGCPSAPKRPGSVVFVGALEERKGFDTVAAAWPDVVARVPGATLAVVGSGRLLERAEELARRPEVTLLVDPPRAEVHRTQRAAQVAVLLSRRTSRWREQVGLPVVEALAHGCTVVTTAETGLATWLDENGHVVLDGSAGPDRAADALVAALAREPRPAGVLAALPDRDGRLAADAWLFPDDGS